MTMRDLEIFLAIVEQGSMSKAAASLFISQPSVSLAISELEREYNVCFFERINRKLFLTETGREFATYAKNMLSLNQMTQDFLRCRSNVERINIGATGTVGSCIIAPLTKQLKERFPRLLPYLYVANNRIIEEQLMDNQLDIALVEGKIVSPNLVAEQVLSDKMVLICSKRHPFWGRSSVNIQELAGQSVVLRERGSGSGALLEDILRKKGIAYHVACRCYQLLAVIDAVNCDLGISVISSRLLKKSFLHSDIWACPLEGANLFRTFNLVYHKDKHFTQQMKVFGELCVQYGQSEEPIED